MSYEATVSTPTLSLHISVPGSAVLLQCHGNVTFETSDFLVAEVKSRIPENGQLILDLSDVTRMDSRGLGAIVGLYLSAKTRNCALEIINLSKQVRRLFALSNLLSLTRDGEPDKDSH